MRSPLILKTLINRIENTGNGYIAGSIKYPKVGELNKHYNKVCFSITLYKSNTTQCYNLELDLFITCNKSFKNIHFFKKLIPICDLFLIESLYSYINDTFIEVFSINLEKLKSNESEYVSYNCLSGEIIASRIKNNI